MVLVGKGKRNNRLGAGLITNDFISRMDLYLWICAVYVEEAHRGNNYGSLLIDKAKRDAKEAKFDYLYLSTDHIGYYENLDSNILDKAIIPGVRNRESINAGYEL